MYIRSLYMQTYTPPPPLAPSLPPPTHTRLKYVRIHSRIMYVCVPVSIKKTKTHTHHTWIYLRLICNINYCMSPSFSNAPPPIRIRTYVQAGHGKARHTRRLLTPVCIPAHSKKGLCWKWREMKVTTQCQCVTVVHVCALSENGNWDMKHTTR